MFDAQKLLGQLLSSGMKSKKRKSGSSSMFGGMGGSMGSGMKGAAAMGVLGVGMAAFEHFMQKRKSEQAGMPASSQSPSFPSAAPPPPPPGGARATPGADNEAVLRLLRSMIAAAHADGVVDAQERKTIMDRLNDTGMSADEQLFMIREMDAPWTAEALAAGVTDPAYASQLYAAALIAIDADTAAEQAYLQRLAGALRLSTSDVETLHQQFA